MGAGEGVNAGVNQLGLAADTLLCPDGIANNQNLDFGLHYTAHPRLMPAINEIDGLTGNLFRTHTLDSVRNTSDLLLYSDGAQVENSAGTGTWGVAATAYQLNGFALNDSSSSKNGLFRGPGVNLSESIDGGTNEDAVNFTGNAGNLRWRHFQSGGDGTTPPSGSANVAYLDVHADSNQYRSQNDTGILKQNVSLAR